MTGIVKKGIIKMIVATVIFSGISFVSFTAQPQEAKALIWIKPSKQCSVSMQYDIPTSLLDKNGNVQLGKFNQKVKGKSAWKDPKTGYTKEKDTAGHGGKKWKIKDKKGKRKASTDGNGKILSK
ncbi:hypothetical protein [Listeria costaricensis]|uniref:hypothetical protein n=1 Tax=Listeria costaricensis TaxID=2026604 RepID=UPI0019694F24|nr:hypothetical protein [Listeria costaricensis]